jgi:PAS domain S-box-containing protein
LPTGRALRAAIVVGLTAIVLLGTGAVAFSSRVTARLTRRVEAITGATLPAAMTLSDLRTQTLIVRGAAIGAASARDERSGERLEMEAEELRRLLEQHERQERPQERTDSTTLLLHDYVERFIAAAREVASAGAAEGPRKSDANWWHRADQGINKPQSDLLALLKAHTAWHAAQVRSGVATTRLESAAELRQLSVASGLAAAAAAGILLLVLRWMERDRRASEAAFEEMRRQREELSRLALAVNRSPSSVMICNAAGEIEWCSEGFTRMTGYSPADAIGRKPGRLLGGPETDPVVVERMNAAVHEGRGVSEQIVNYTRDGRKYWVEDECQPLRDGDGMLTGFMVIQSDISERKRLQRELEATAVRLSTAVRAAGVGVWELDVRTDEVACDETLRQLYGLAPSDPTPPAAMLREAVHPEDLALMWRRKEEALRGDGEYRADIRVRRVDGQWRHLHVAAAVLRSGDGTPLRVVGVAIDMTDRVNTQRALLESRARLAVFADHAPAAVAMFDTQMRYLLCSRRWLAEYGLEGENVVGRSHYEVFPEIPTRWREVHARCLAGKVETCEEDPFERCDGTVQWLRWEVRPWYTSSGAIGGVLMMTEDITARREAQEALRTARSQAEAANRAKSEFLANMSHEIRTPMTAILGYLDLLDEVREDPAAYASHAETIKRNADHLLAIINDVLDLSKIEAGKMAMERVACSPASIAAEVVALLEPRARSKGLTLAIDMRGEIPSQVSTDPTRLRQILTNLVGNAVKFTERGGVTVELSMVADQAGGPARMRYAVRDTGIGIEPDRLRELFQPFTQADTSMTRRFGGTGLGLAICRRLAELLGGEVSAVSEAGRGSEFVVTLEVGSLEGVAMVSGVQSGEERSGAGAKPAMVGSLSGRVLVVEDGVDNQRLITHHLKRAGAEVEIANNGQRAVERLCEGGDVNGPLAAEAFALVLMDMQMPVMDGYAATRLLREKGYTGAIVALTAHAMTGDREECLAAGCDDYLSKPIDRAAMIALCEKWMRERGTGVAGVLGAGSGESRAA